MSAPKISILTHDISGGTFTNLCPALVRGLRELNADCNLIVLNATPEELSQFEDIPVVTLNVKRTAFSLFAVVRYLQDYKPDIILPMPWYFNIVAVWAKYLSGVNTKVILGEHNIISLEASVEHRDKLHLRFLPILMRCTYPYGDGLVGVSKDTITDLVETLKIKAKIPKQVIFNPINSDHVKRLAQASLEHRWFSNSEIPIIFTVARLAKQKRLDGLLQAFAQIVHTTPARLLILGEGPLRAELEYLCKELDIEESVWMPGYDSNPYRYMANCDVFVLASAWEGCPVALQEAMVCGAAVVVTDAPGGMKDIVDNGKFGVITPTNDPSLLAEKIVQILKQPDLKKYYQEQAKQRSQVFDYQNIAQQYLDFCNSCLAPISKINEVIL